MAKARCSNAHHSCNGAQTLHGAPRNMYIYRPIYMHLHLSQTPWAQTCVYIYIDWLIHSFIHSFIDWFIDSLIHWFIDWLIDWLIDCYIVILLYCYIVILLYCYIVIYIHIYIYIYIYIYLRYLYFELWLVVFDFYVRSQEQRLCWLRLVGSADSLPHRTPQAPTLPEAKLKPGATEAADGGRLKSLQKWKCAILCHHQKMVRKGNPCIGNPNWWIDDHPPIWSIYPSVDHGTHGHSFSSLIDQETFVWGHSLDFLDMTCPNLTTLNKPQTKVTEWFGNYNSGFGNYNSGFGNYDLETMIWKL